MTALMNDLQMIDDLMDVQLSLSKECKSFSYLYQCFFFKDEQRILNLRASSSFEYEVQ